MKKFLFSAFALIAFSFTSVAGNDLSNIDKEILEDIKNSTILKTDTPCADAWLGAYDANMHAGMGHSYSDAYADVVFNKCMKDTYGG
jgi:hypothetical protein